MGGQPRQVAATSQAVRITKAERDRQILIMRRDHATEESIARAFGISFQRVSQILKKQIALITKYFDYAITAN
jgi:DNA-directed RNA polymerase specialized sigma subunit